MANARAETDTPLVDHALVRAWLGWALAWLTVFPLIGLLLSIKFHVPEFLGDQSWLTFGRLRPVHVNGVIFGAFSTAILGLCYWMVPKLCGRPMAKARWGWWQLWVWNLFLAAGSVSFLLGHNLGFEADEYTWPFNILRAAVLLAFTGQVLVTVFRRRERGLYVSLWYLMAGLVWTIMNLVLGNLVLPYVPMSGINNAALHGLFIHYVVGLWITPMGLAVIYYFLPLAVKKPLYAHRLSLLGFWTIAFFYPFVGTHHYLYSPIPFHTQTVSIVTSMMLIIPVWAVTVNFFGTALGRWGRIAGGADADAYAAKFLLLGAVFYWFGCFQGSVEALRRMQELTHFSDFVIGHSHSTIFGAFITWIAAGIYYVWPRVTGRQLAHPRLASWHLWLTIFGFSVMFVGLVFQGFVQGTMLENGANFVDSVREMKPWWFARTLAGGTMDVGLILFVVNLVRTARHGAPFTEETPYDDGPTQARPAGAVKGGLVAAPSRVVLIAGLLFFALAVINQGILPSLSAETNTPEVTDRATGLTIRATDYTPEERRGRRVYIREGCWYCHSQYVRPVTGESRRWGPVSQAGEYVFDQPHLLSTRRIGPDLTRIGLKYGDGWHAAHHWNPRQVVPDSIMPRFPWLFAPAEGDGPPQLNDDGRALVAYLQKLGTDIGDWRETFAPTRLGGGAAPTVGAGGGARDGVLALGRNVYRRRCVGCHGPKGDGQGPSARFVDPKPRDFTKGIFKFRSTPGKDSLPTDADLYITVSHGLWGTAMPPWYVLSTDERMAVIQYLKTFSDRWRTEAVKRPVDVPEEPAVTAAGLAAGRKSFEQRCALCHGKQGHGDGPIARALKDTWGHPVRPADFTLPAGTPGGVKLGHDAPHLFRTIMTGVGGTPMPVFGTSLQPREVWNIVHHVQSLRVAAHMDELTAEGLAAGDAETARRRLWANLSEAAGRGDIEAAVVERGAVVAKAPPPADGGAHPDAARGDAKKGDLG
jgi:cbb3-type cytochrome c oxidase subunit I